MNLSVRLRVWLEQRKLHSLQREERLIELTDAAERKAIAKAFNDRYCMADRYDTSSEMEVPGDRGSFGMGVLEGNRWMCPDCNALHAPLRNSVFVGLIYPACCSFAENYRYDTLGANGSLKRPLGMFGPSGLLRKKLQLEQSKK